MLFPNPISGHFKAMRTLDSQGLLGWRHCCSHCAARASAPQLRNRNQAPSIPLQQSPLLDPGWYLDGRMDGWRAPCREGLWGAGE